MFQKNLPYRHNTQYKEFAEQLLKKITEDEQLMAYIRSTQSEEERNRPVTSSQAESALIDIGSKFSDENLKNKFNTMASLVRNLRSFTNDEQRNAEFRTEPGSGVVSITDTKAVLRGQIWSRIIVDINQLNGVDAQTVFPTLSVPTDAEKTGLNFTEQLHETFSANDYADLYKDNPIGKIAMHIGQISDDITVDLSEFATKAQIDNFKYDFMEDINGGNTSTEKELVDYISEVEKKLVNKPSGSVLETIIDEKALQKYMDDIKKKKEELAIKQAISDVELEERLLETPSLKKTLDDRKTVAKKDIVREMPSGIEAELENYKANLEQLRNDSIEMNKEIAEENRQVSLRNAEREQQISDILKARDEQLAELDKIDPEIFAANETEKWKEARAEADKKLQPLKEKAAELSAELKKIENGEAAVGRLKDEANTPDEAHFQAVKKEEENIDSLNKISEELYGIGGNQRYAAYLDSDLTEENTKLFNEKSKKLESLEAALNKQTEGLTINASADESMAAYRKIQAITEDITKVKEEIELMGRPGKALEAIQNFRKSNPELAKEFDEAKTLAQKNGTYRNGVNDYTIIDNLIETHRKKELDIKSEYSLYYKDKEIADRFNNSLNDVTARKIELANQLHEIDEQIKELNKVPDADQFERNLNERLKEFKSKEEIEVERRQINENAENQIRSIRDSMEETEELRDIKSDDEINREVDNQKINLERVYEAKVGAELDKRMVSITKEVLDTCKKNYHDKLTAQEKQLDNDSFAVFDAKTRATETYNRAKLRNENLGKMTELWNNMKSGNQDAVSMLENRINSFAGSIDNGTKKGHKNTDEFMNMKNRLNDVKTFIGENKELLKSGDREKTNEFKAMLELLKQASQVYYAKKQTGIHLIPSNMRFVRLQFANDISRFCDFASEHIENHVSVAQQRSVIGGKLMNYSMNNKHIEKFPEYAEFVNVCHKAYGEKKVEQNAPSVENIAESKEAVKDPVL